MIRTLSSLLVAGLILSSETRVSGDAVLRSALHDYRVVTVVEALVQPWSIAFLPGGDTLITERPGRLRILRDGKLLPQPVEGVPAGASLGPGRAARSGAPSELRVQPDALPDLLEAERRRRRRRPPRSSAAASRTIA